MHHTPALKPIASSFKPGSALMSTIAEELLEQGLQQGLQQGELKGLHAGIRLALKVKFGAVSEPLLTAIAPIEDVALLQAFADAIEHAESAEALQAWLTDQRVQRKAESAK